MAASRGSMESGMENKQGIRAAEISPHGQIIRNFKECFSCLLHSITEFGSELKTSENQAVNITVNESDFNLDDIKPSHLYSCLQRHISKLQGVSAYLKQIVDSETMLNNEATEKSRKDLATTSQVDLVADAGVVPATSHLSFGVNDTMKAQVDDSSIQIKAGKAEIERRISAFIERKQLEINENNVREFCNVINCNQENSCARTDAVFTPYPGFRSHVKVTRVVNTYGPQTQGRHSDQGVQQQGLYSRDCGNPAIEERLHNIEAHLNLTAGPVPHSIYQRLKKLEDRILELEGLSPEYFHSTSYSHKRLKASVSQNYSLSELDGKISAVRTALLKRASEFQSSEMRVPL